MNRREFLGAGVLAAGAAALGGCASGAAARSAASGGRVKFRLGMAGWTFKEFKLGPTLEALEKLGVHELCVKDFHLDYRSDAAGIRTFAKACADHGVRPYGLGPVDTDTMDDVKAAFDCAKALGVDVIVAVPSKVVGRQRVADRALCERISPLCDEYGINLAIHNHGPDNPECFPTGDSACEFVKDLSPRMGMCLDIGHNLRGGKDPVETIRRYRDRLFDFHLKDIRRVPGQLKAEAKILGRGELDLPAIFRALREVGYARCCSIEYETNYTDNFSDLCECVGYARGLMNAIGGD